MNKKIILLLCSFFVASATYAASGEEWSAPPQEITFKEFQFMKTVHHAGKPATFEKQTKPAFKLKQPFDGDQTKLCYGVTKVDPKTHESFGIACVQSSVHVTSCKDLNVTTCGDDGMLAPIR